MTEKKHQYQRILSGSLRSVESEDVFSDEPIIDHDGRGSIDIEASRSHSNNNSSHGSVGNNSMHSSTGNRKKLIQRIAGIERPSPFKLRKSDRMASYHSLGSYSSLVAAEEEAEGGEEEDMDNDGENVDHHDDDNDDDDDNEHDDDEDEEEDDDDAESHDNGGGSVQRDNKNVSKTKTKENNHTSNNKNDVDGEREPFRDSYDEDDRPTAPASRSNTASPDIFQSTITTQIPPSTNIYTSSSSFNLDDEDDDVDADLKKYNLDFSTHDSIAATMANSGEYHFALPTMSPSAAAAAAASSFPNATFAGDVNPNNNSPSSNNNKENTRTIGSMLRFLWYSFQSVRQQARQRRAQRLLQQSERTWHQTLWMGILTYCDATDPGILLVAVLMLLWIILLVTISSRQVVFHLFVVGLGLFTLRFSARPLYQCIQKRRQKYRRERRRQQQKQQQQQRIPQIRQMDTITNRHASTSHGAISTMIGNTNQLSSSNYLDYTPERRPRLDTPPRKEFFELPSIKQRSPPSSLNGNVVSSLSSNSQSPKWNHNNNGGSPASLRSHSLDDPAIHAI